MADAKERLARIAAIVTAHPTGIATPAIADALGRDVPRRTIQHDLKILTDRGVIVREGDKRWARYRPRGFAEDDETTSSGWQGHIPLSEGGNEVRAYVRQPILQRRPVGYDPAFLSSYRPNRTAWLTDAQRQSLRQIGSAIPSQLPAGTYARHILDRLLIDLS